MNSLRTLGEKGDAHHDRNDLPAGAPGTLWVKQPGHGSYDNDRPPIIHIISRETGEERCWVIAHSDKETCHGILAEAVRPTIGHEPIYLAALAAERLMLPGYNFHFRYTCRRRFPIDSIAIDPIQRG
jgi:hypothetical protein